jgi:hypothetical protein
MQQSSLVRQHERTHPLKQTSEGRVLVVYCFHEYTRNVRFFMRHGLHIDPQVDYAFVQNVPAWSAGAQKLERMHKQLGRSKVHWIRRCNRNNDFGGYSEAVRTLDTAKYDFFVFLNSSMRGPFLPTCFPANTHWCKPFVDRLNDQVALVGASINYYHGVDPHVQSMLLCMDQRGLGIYRQHGIFFPNNAVAVSKDDLISRHEIRGSRVVMQHGYNLDCMLLAMQGRNWHEPQTFEPFAPDQFDFWGNRRYYGYNIHPYETVFMKTNRPFDLSDTILNLLTLWMERTEKSEAGVMHPMEEWLDEHDFVDRDMHVSDNQRGLRAWTNPAYERERWVWLSAVLISTGMAVTFLTLWLLARRRAVA